jgi:hypothetical protein
MLDLLLHNATLPDGRTEYVGGRAGVAASSRSRRACMAPAAETLD